MKTIQWIIAIVVLAMMVFLITIAMNFLGESSSDDNGTPPPSPAEQQVGEPILTFPTTSFRGGSSTYFEQETNESGHRDFLFANETDEAVVVTLKSKSCTCTGVQLLLAPNEWASRMGPYLHPALFSSVGQVEVDRLLGEVADKQSPTVLTETSKDPKSEVTVPPRTAGWIRITWKRERAEPQLFTAELITKNKSRTAFTRLEAAVRFWDAVRFLETEIGLNEIRVEELQNRQMPKQAIFKFWSSTRSQLHPQATVLARGKAGTAPLVIGEPQPLDAKELAELQKEIADKSSDKTKAPVPLTCAYRLPVTLLDRSPDGKQPFPFGPFRTRIRVTFDNVEGIEPTLLMINGKLLGDVRIGGGLDGRLSFGSFDASLRTNRLSVMLYSDVPGLELEIDKERTPPFLAQLAKIEKISTGDEGSWKVSTQIPANSVSGQFPREDNELFDCAVYVKTKGDASRSLRIPADGVAIVK